ncbi:S8 family peptidase [Mesorhizobium sp.]|uniref:S8 family peptidase n=1 Tax=Mesorhizobium sp. TaxID=1871066 RepID=UPI000FE5DB9D|nr:S8 family peptidase [Mesorhizobium sp.]RWK76782.1 MAG: S8 family peptidase [Mesorhizobium sp.]RWP80329.1 MAG: S8 family peptidase [Mesorhizobium sp.]
MPNNPVQIILNDRDFHQAPDPGQPPRNKDFFEGADKEFVAHRDSLLAAIDRIIDEIRESPYGPAAYLRIQMRNEALAKSYRPVWWLFKPDQFPCVGADAVGTLYFRAPLIYLKALRQRIEKAEATVEIKYRRVDNKPYKAPTIARAEVGAIETIEIAPPEQKRAFSTAAALAALEDPRAVSGYQIELFETPYERVIADDPIGKIALRRSLEQLLLSLGLGARSYLAFEVGRTPVLEVQLTTQPVEALIDNRTGVAGSDSGLEVTTSSMDYNPERHEAALTALQKHPLVRAILPPVLLELTDDRSKAGPETGAKPVTIPTPQEQSVYPIVGVIDSGVAPILDDWVAGRFDYLSPGEYDAAHGTNVAGLLTIGQALNNPAVAPEANGCHLYDIPLYPSGPFMSRYPRGFSDFLEEIEQAVAQAKAERDVRVFNLSINAVAPVERHRYSIYASRLDQIADAYGVIFVNSAGNLPPSQSRSAWQKRPVDVINYFASRTSPDTIFKPAESVRSISVGALNPPDTGQIADAPTVYTARGPGLQVGVKPDVACYGGAGGSGLGRPTGLSSVSSKGAKESVVGTSFAAPLVARTLAGLDVATEGGLSVDALRAMLLHHTAMPEPLTKRGLRDIGRQFAGFGKPRAVNTMLETDDHQITLLFQSRLSIGEKKPVILRFPFTWPRSLVTDGRCSGRAKITLVYSPPLDPAFGAEFVRVNLEASLKQRQAEPAADGGIRFTNQVAARYLPKSTNLAIPEKALIDHGLKWWPSKQYESTFAENGSSSQWRLEVTSLVRAEAQFPAEGVPFAVVLTLEDPDGDQPVFGEMRQWLQSSNAVAQDVRTATRLRPRG